MCGLRVEQARLFCYGALHHDNSTQEIQTMDKYVCTLCGYVYDPAVGDPDSGIAPGTKFEDIPDDWSCPVCGASKADFVKED